MTTNSEVYWQLGAAGLTWDEANTLLKETADQAHGWTDGVTDIPNTTRQLVYTNGMDGWDAHYFLQDK
jgi:hypothetical protein